MVLFCISGSMAHNIWSSLETNQYIAQQYRIYQYTLAPTDYEKNQYNPPWARYHAHGVGVLFGWLILAERQNQIISKFLKQQKLFIKWFIVVFAWGVSLSLLWFIIFGVDQCFNVDYIDPPKYLVPVSNKTGIH